MIKGVDKVLKLADDQTKIISGHGPLGDKKQLQKYRDMLAVAYERLSRLKAEGNSVSEAVPAKPLLTSKTLGARASLPGINGLS